MVLRQRMSLLNKKKHGFYFSEITDVFDDSHLMDWYDNGHSSMEEDRYICLGRWRDMVILFVAFTERDGIVHLITAREATPKERKAYDENYRRETSGN
ncbi:hypothetical protein AGMMS50293_09040 [Spirochaetia bacterium]|nr:hypothetical protein AGMMS50293_09040 [Spirochaetia bacterium]